MAFNKVGFHAGVGGNRTGIGAYMQQLNAAGIPFSIKSVNDAGLIVEAVGYAQASGVDHNIVLRFDSPSGQENATPDYSLPPDQAAAAYWQLVKGSLNNAPELASLKDFFWVEPFNEARTKNNPADPNWGNMDAADWLGWFAHYIGELGNNDGYKILCFGMNAGEPEPQDWLKQGMVEFLKSCDAKPDRLGVSLHEYKIGEGVDMYTPINDLIPHIYGRFIYLFAACDQLGLARPAVFITESGWVYNDMPVVSIAMTDVDVMARLYTKYRTVRGSFLWNLAGGAQWAGLPNKLQKLIQPITQYTLNTILPEPDDPPIDPPPIDPPPTGAWVTVINERFLGYNDPKGSDWVDQNGVQQVRLDETLEFYSGYNHQVPPDDQEDNQYGLFEAIHRWGAFLPPNEWPILLNDWGHAFKMFARQQAWKSWTRKFLLDSQGQKQPLPAGRYRIKLLYYDDNYVGKNGDEKIPPPDPLSFEARIGIGDESIPWRPSNYLQDNEIIEEFEITEPAPAWYRFRGRHANLNISAWVKLFIVERWDENSNPDPDPDPICRGVPRVQYRRTYVLIPTNYGAEWGAAAVNATWGKYDFTVGKSADDAGIGDLDFRRVLAVNPAEWGAGGALVSFFAQYYPDVIVEIIYAETPAILASILETYDDDDGGGGNPDPDPDPPPDFMFTDWPVDSFQVNQRFGENPQYYGQFGLPGHDGWDFHAPTGSNVYAVAGGVVSDIRQEATGHNYGRFVRVRHGDSGYETTYAHLDSISVSLGQQVTSGQLLGKADNTGNSNGSHLHLTLKHDEAVVGGSTYIGYPYKIVDPSPFLYPIWPSPPPIGDALFGLHGTADVRTLSPSERSEEAAIFTTADVDMVKVLSATDPDLVAQLSILLPNAAWVVRAFLSFRGRTEPVTPAQFFEWTASDTQRTLDRIGSGRPVVIELHNEPNLFDEGLGVSWGNGTQFGQWLIAVAQLYRSQFPNIPLIFPGLSPGGTVAGVRYDSVAFLNEAAAAVANMDGLGVHIYWNSLPPNDPNYYPMENGIAVLDQCLAMVSGKPVWVTEASNNKGASDQNMAADYVMFWNYLKQRPRVVGVTYYVSSASDPAYAAEVWKGRNIATLVGGR